jgi:hypothetical protein
MKRVALLQGIFEFSYFRHFKSNQMDRVGWYGCPQKSG